MKRSTSAARMQQDALPNLHAAQPCPAVLVTGASAGIGKAIAVFLAEHGWHVLAGVRTMQAAAAIDVLHEMITPLVIDVSR